MKDFQLQPALLKNNFNLFLNWKVTRYALLFVLASLSVSSLALVSYKSDLIFFSTRLLQISLFVFLGILHSDSLEKRPLFSNFSVKEKFYSSMVLSLLIYGALLLFYFILNSETQRMSIASSCSFLLPYLLIQSWNYYLLLPENMTYTWSGYKKIYVDTDIAYLNSKIILVRLAKKSGMNEESSFLVNIPLNMELGKVFNSFLNIENKDDNIEIECVDENNIPFSWHFYFVSFGGLYKRMLDPEKSLQSIGRIKKNTTIRARRVEKI